MTRESLVNRDGLLAVLIVTCLSVAAFAAPSEDLIHSFFESGPIIPIGNLVADGTGNLYGTTLGGETGGIVYELVRPVPPSTQWTLNVLYTSTEGALRYGVIFDSSGNLYGTANRGGTSGFGVVFELTPPAAEGGQWTETVLYNFQGGPTDGASPNSGLAFDSSGNLYGVTESGGPRYCQGNGGCGVVFELTPPATEGGAWTETVIHFFDGREGWGPSGTPVLDGKGNLYGATILGGITSSRKDGFGTVYRLAAPAARQAEPGTMQCSTSSPAFRWMVNIRMAA